MTKENEEIKEKDIEEIKGRLNAIGCDLGTIAQRTQKIYSDLKGEMREEEGRQDNPSEGHIPEINHKLGIAESYLQDIKKDLTDIEGVI